jgi:ferritin
MAQTKECKKQFLELFKGILEKTDKAKKQITEMISDIINRIKEYEISQIDEPQPEYSESEPEMEEPEGEDEIEKLIRSTQQGTIDSEEKEIKDMTPVELSEYIKSLRKSELQALIDQCIDSGDFATLGRLQPFIKESLEWKIYESEIKQFLK